MVLKRKLSAGDLFGLLLLLVVAGCSQNRVHRLHDQPDAGSAVLMISGGVNVYKIDGEAPSFIGDAGLSRSWQYPDVLEMLPGEHKLEVSFKGGFLDSQPLTTLSLNAETGHTYIVGAIIYVSRKSGRKSWRAVIVDKGLDYDGGCSEEPIYKSVR